MSLSLNAVDGEVLYDTNIDFYIDMYKFAGELVFSFSFPEILYHLSDCYCVDVDDGAFELECLKSQRKVVIAGTRNWITPKNEDGESNISKAKVFTSMIIAIEVKPKEMEDVISLFSENKDSIKSKISSLLQNAVEIALYRYNEKAGGTSFLTPSYKACDRIEVTLYKNYVEKRYKRCYCRFYDFKLIGESENPIKIEAFNEPVKNWRYFYNKSVNELLQKNYIDSIISAAISIEAFSWGIVEEQFVSEEKIEAYASEPKDGKDSFLSATKLYKKLIKDGYIKSTLSNTKLEDCIQKILNPRNDIMHGKRSVVGPWRVKAEEVNNLIKTLYTSLGQDISPECFLEKGDQNKDIGKYRKFVLTTNYNSDISLQEMNELSEKILDEFPHMELPKLNAIRYLIKSNIIDEALEKTRELMSETTNGSAIAVELWQCFPQGYFDKKKDLFSMVLEKDERVLTIIGLEMLREYQREGRIDQSKLITALDYLREANKKNVKYVLTNIIACEVLEEMNSDERYKYYIQFVDIFTCDCIFPLMCCECAMRLEDANSMMKYLTVFADRFEKHHLIGIKADFYTIKIDLENIVNIAVSCISYLKNRNIGDADLLEIEKKINRNSSIPLKNSVQVLDCISVFDKGNMPQGNIIIGNPLNVVEGFYIYK